MHSLSLDLHSIYTQYHSCCRHLPQSYLLSGPKKASVALQAQTILYSLKSYKLKAEKRDKEGGK